MNFGFIYLLFRCKIKKVNYFFFNLQKNSLEINFYLKKKLNQIKKKSKMNLRSNILTFHLILLLIQTEYTLSQSNTFLILISISIFDSINWIKILLKKSFGKL